MKNPIHELKPSENGFELNCLLHSDEPFRGRGLGSTTNLMQKAIEDDVQAELLCYGVELTRSALIRLCQDYNNVDAAITNYFDNSSYYDSVQSCEEISRPVMIEESKNNLTHISPITKSGRHVEPIVGGECAVGNGPSDGTRRKLSTTTEFLYNHGRKEYTSLAIEEDPDDAALSSLSEFTTDSSRGDWDFTNSQTQTSITNEEVSKVFSILEELISDRPVNEVIHSPLGRIAGEENKSLMRFHEFKISVQNTARLNRARFLLMADTQKLAMKYEQLTKANRAVVTSMEILKSRELTRGRSTNEISNVTAGTADALLLSSGAIKLDPIRHGCNVLASVIDVKALHDRMMAARESTFEDVVKEIDSCTKTPGIDVLCGLYLLSAGAVRKLALLCKHLQRFFPATHCTVGPLKRPYRSLEKSRLDYDSDPLRLLDIVRASIVCPSVEMMAAVVRSFNQLSEGLVVVRVKNGFQNLNAVATNGYRDIKLNVWIPVRDNDPHNDRLDGKTAPGGAGIIGEIQLHLAAFYDLKQHVGHKLYSWIRKFDVYGMTSPDVLLIFEASVAEATASLCAENAFRLLIDSSADIASGVVSPRVACDRDSLTPDEQLTEEIALADNSARSPVVLGVNGSVDDERLGRELEVLCCFQAYRTNLATSAIYRSELQAVDSAELAALSALIDFAKKKVSFLDELTLFGGVDDASIFPLEEISAVQVNNTVTEHFDDEVMVALYLEFLVEKLGKSVFKYSRFHQDLATIAFESLRNVYTEDSPRFLAAYLKFYSDQFLPEITTRIFSLSEACSVRVNLRELLLRDPEGDHRKCWIEDSHRLTIHWRASYAALLNIFAPWPCLTWGLLMGLQYGTYSRLRDRVILLVLLILTISPLALTWSLEESSRKCLQYCFKLRSVLKISRGVGHKLWFHNVVENLLCMPLAIPVATNAFVAAIYILFPPVGDSGSGVDPIKIFVTCCGILLLWLAESVIFVPRTKLTAQSAKQLWQLAHATFGFCMVIFIFILAYSLVIATHPVITYIFISFELIVGLFAFGAFIFFRQALAFTKRDTWNQKNELLIHKRGLSCCSSSAVIFIFVFFAFWFLWDCFAIPEQYWLKRKAVPVSWLPDSKCTYTTNYDSEWHKIYFATHQPANISISCTYAMTYSFASDDLVPTSDVHYFSSGSGSLYLPLCPGDRLYVDGCPNVDNRRLPVTCEGQPKVRLYDSRNNSRVLLFAPSNQTVLCPYNIECPRFHYTVPLPYTNFSSSQKPSSGLLHTAWNSATDFFGTDYCTLLRVEGYYPNDGCPVDSIRESGHCHADMAVEVTIYQLPLIDTFDFVPMIISGLLWIVAAAGSLAVVARSDYRKVPSSF